MLIDIENKAESTLVIEYNDRVYKIATNQTEQMDFDSLEFEISAYYELIETVDLELDKKRLKYRFIQKAVDKLIKFGKQLMIQTKVKYKVRLNNVSTLKFEFGAFGKDTNLIQELLDMPAELVSFARLECDGADICVADCEAINKKEFLRIYRRTYLWVNWNVGIIFALICYLPSYTKQKIITSKRHLKKKIKNLYSVSPEERENLIDIETDDDDETDENKPQKKGGWLKPLIFFGFITVIVILILMFKCVTTTE